jgi:Protein of unknown function (DUF3843)
MADYTAHRPQDEGQGDSHLPKIVRKLKDTLADAQRGFAHDSLRLPPKSLSELAGILVDFAEDLHSGNGIWEAYERYNLNLFGIALPLTSKESRSRLNADRYRHFLWILYPMLLDGLVVSPTHQDIQRVAEAARTFLSDVFAKVPKDSGVKTLLGSSNTFGWEVKRKLIWLGTHSFMFRGPFVRYLGKHKDSSSVIAHTDDFICQECTGWSGLGAIDILAEVLDICDDDRRDLRSWYERHAAFYRIDAVEKQTLDAMNIVNDQPYRIRIKMGDHPFRRGQLVFGSLVPWRGEWYWSGEQQSWDDASKVDVEDMKRTMRRQSPAIVCRYSKDYEAQVRQMMSVMHEKMLAFHNGKDLVTYSDGLAMAADWQKELRWQWESRSRQEAEEVARKHALKKGRPEMNIPQDLLEEKDGLGVFLNPDEGKEIMSRFTTLLTGLRKKGEGLTEVEQDAIRGFFDSPAISPEFVRRVLEEQGQESVKAAFLLRGNVPEYWLDYLLRSHKGHFYRKRYPSLSVA